MEAGRVHTEGGSNWEEKRETERREKEREI